MPQRRLSPVEFVAMMAMLVATVAFSIDAMLPALPRIAQELTPEAPNRAQLILTVFLRGMGLGTFFAGPLSDRFGRKPVVLSGVALYIAGAALAGAAPTLELLVLARLVQGLGAAAPRIVAIAIVRDLYAGREMARLVSFVMMIFTLVPAVAPLLGSGIIALGGWRGIFVAFIGFAGVSAGWLALRLDEPLGRARRRPLRWAAMRGAVAEMLVHPAVRLSIVAQTFCYAQLFISISLIQPVFDETFGVVETFPWWFFGMALIAGTASLLNALLVMRLGMRRLVTSALGAQVVASALMLSVWFAPLPPGATFYLFAAWMTTIFFQTGLTLGNLNAIAMEPVGHIAGMAASVIGAVSTVLAAVVAVPVGLAFDGTPVPLAAGILGASACGFAVMLRMVVVERRQPG